MSIQKPARFDLHTHSTRSDGVQTPEEVVHSAREEGVEVLALTDHNCLNAPLAAELSRISGLEVIPACEFSAMHATAGILREIHVIGLWLEETPEITGLLLHSRMERKPYLMAYLNELERLGVDLSGCHDPERAYQLLEAENQGTAFGRLAICRRMVSLGYIRSVEEGFREWIGRAPEDRPRVRVRPEDFMHYAPLERVVSAIHSCPGGVAVLCHPFFPSPEEEVEDLVRYFAETLHGDAMEVWYGTGAAAYTPAQTRRLLALAERYHLLHSAGSDRHGPERPFFTGHSEVFSRLARYHRRLLESGRFFPSPS